MQWEPVVVFIGPPRILELLAGPPNDPATQPGLQCATCPSAVAGNVVQYEGKPIRRNLSNKVNDLLNKATFLFSKKQINRMLFWCYFIDEKDVICGAR